MINECKFPFLRALFVLENKENVFETESFDGDVWNQVEWKRVYFLWFTFIIIFFIVIIINFSFSDTYGVYQWYFMALLKLAQILIEECIKATLINE